MKNFITSTHTLQINDGRLIPIYVPKEEEHIKIVSLVDKILEFKKQRIITDIEGIEKEINSIVYDFYNISRVEIDIIENLVR